MSSRAVPARRVEGVRSGAGAPRRQRRLPRRGDPRARRGERVREIDIAGIASGFVHPDEGAVEIGGTERRRVSPAETRRLGLGMAYQTLLARPRPVGGREPLSRGARRATTDVRAHGGVGGGAGSGSSSSTSRRRRPPGRCRSPSGSSSRSSRPARQAEGAAPRRADDGARAGGRRAAPRARVRAEPRRRRHRLRQPPAAGGARHRRPRHRPSRRRLPGDVRGRHDVGGEPRRADDRAAAPARLPGARTTRDGAGRCSSPSPACSGERFGPIDLDVAKGEILGIAGAEGNGQVQFLRALAGVERSTGSAVCDGSELDTTSPLGPLRAGVVLLSGDRAGESLFPVLSVRANTTIQVLRRLGRVGFLHRRRERRTVDDLVRRLSIRMASIEQPVQSLSGGNQQKVSLTRPFLRGDVKVILAEEPTQGVDVAARFDIYDALRDEGEGRRRDHRQVERSARARRALRPRRRDVARDDRRRDPRRRARRAPDRRGDRRLARAVRASRDRGRAARVSLVRAEALGGSVRGAAARLMTTLIVAVGAYTRPRTRRVPHELQPPEPPARDDAARPRLDRPDERAARRRLRRLRRRR